MALISGLEEPLEEGTTTRCSILVWRIPWTEEPGALQSTGSQRVRQDQSDLAQPSMLCKSQIGALLVFRVYLNAALGRSWGEHVLPPGPLYMVTSGPRVSRAGWWLLGSRSLSPHLSADSTNQTKASPGAERLLGSHFRPARPRDRHHGALDPERSPVLWGGFL